MIVTQQQAEHEEFTDRSARIGKVYKVNNGRVYLFVKRLFDFCASFLGLIVLAIPMLVLGLAIRAESPGPAIYKQERLGKDGKPFTMYKFRSMYMDAEKDGPKWAVKDDVRCTRIGKRIRLNHMDEFPQLINVLKGEMSVVGPRPERDYFYRQFEADIPDFWERLRVKPGLTGLSQVNGCYDLTPRERFDYDIVYMANRSVFADLIIILKTVAVMINHKGAR